MFFSDNGPVFDVDPIAATIAPGLLDAKGNTMGLKGSKGSTYEGGIRVPAIIYWKGVLEKSISFQFLEENVVVNFEAYIFVSLHPNA